MRIASPVRTLSLSDRAPVSSFAILIRAARGRRESIRLKPPGLSTCFASQCEHGILIRSCSSLFLKPLVFSTFQSASSLSSYDIYDIYAVSRYEGVFSCCYQRRKSQPLSNRLVENGLRSSVSAAPFFLSGLAVQTYCCPVLVT